MKRFVGRVLLLLSLCFSVFYVNSQSQNALRVGMIVSDSACITLDTLSIVPSSFILFDVSADAYRLDPIAARLYLMDSTLLGRPLSYRYEVFQLNFSTPYAHKSLSLIEPKRSSSPITMSYENVDSAPEDDSQILSSGSISRGVSIGNGQDIALNSSLNLQLVGRLTEDWQVVASISDKNIPIQAEGNTTTLSNINNIFITLFYKDFVEIKAGDITLYAPKDDDFLQVSRNLSGMSAAVNFSSWKKVSMSNALGGGVSKGKYHRQKLSIQNGVQGPYKLYGASNETSIVLVSGSEKVYLDGRVLTRGQDCDYVIDYNTAEITFTAAQIMTEEKRVYVEFEYTDRHYTRYNIYSYNDFTFGEKKKWRLNVHFFQEQDLKNQSIQPELDNDQKLYLASIGDQVDEAYYSYADSADYSSDRVLYVMKDTLVDGTNYSIYEYSIEAGQQLYSVGFTYMGANKGSYVLLRSTTNGRVFGWVAPTNGQLQGEYSPVMLLTAPQMTQMTTVKVAYDFAENSSVESELAISNYDQNLFSDLDDKDNVGFAYSFTLNHNHAVGSGKDTSDNAWRLRYMLDWQFVQKNFHAVESFRDVEFAREYNLAEDYSSDYSEQMLHALFGISKSEVSTSLYEANWFTRIGDYSAFKQTLSTQNSPGQWTLNAKSSFLISSDSVQRSRYWTLDAQAAYRFSSLEIGISDKAEYDLFRDQVTDTVRSNSFAFNEVQLYLKNRETSFYKYNVNYKNRVEYALQEDALGLDLLIHEVSAKFSINRIKNQQFSTKATYRRQQAYDAQSQTEMEHYFVGDLEYVGRFFKSALILNTYYEAGSGMELQKYYSYIKVASGQGTHVWNDYNGNGVEELDEFEVASFQDEANYVKVWLSGVDYVNTYNAQFTQTVQLRPSAVWGGKTGVRRFLSRFTDVVTLRAQQKNENFVLSPFCKEVTDTQVVASVLNINNTLSFNNSASKFSFDFVVQKLQNKSLLYYGYELSETETQQVVLKSRPIHWLQLRAEYNHGRQGNSSELMQNRCYDIEKHSGECGLILQSQQKYRGDISYLFENKKNIMGEEHLLTHEGSLNFEYRMAKRGVLSVGISYVHIAGDVDENSAVGYQMLNGLSVGDNAIWKLSYQLAVTEYLQLSLQYDGRATDGNAVVHTGNLVIKAQF